MAKSIGISEELIVNKIYHIRGQKVMLDRDLAEMYEVETKQLKRQVVRNIERFPEEFMFELTKEEFDDLRSQNGTSSWGGTRYLPYAFTEHGVLMLSSVLNSPIAIQVNIRIIKIFTRLREELVKHKDILLKLEQIDKKIINLGLDIKSHDGEIETLFKLVDEIRKESEQPNKLKRNPMGYKLPKPKKR
jgi:phage regulator Rha-like protein